MRKKLIIILKSNTGKARRKKAFKVFGPTKRIRRKEFVKQLFYLTGFSEEVSRDCLRSFEKQGAL